MHKIIIFVNTYIYFFKGLACGLFESVQQGPHRNAEQSQRKQGEVKEIMRTLQLPDWHRFHVAFKLDGL